MIFKKTSLMMVTLGLSTCAMAAVSLSSLKDTSTQDGMKTYTIQFVPSYSPKTHPYHYSGPHHTVHMGPFTGATYGKGFSLFAVGKYPTPGLEILSEMGSGAGLKVELKNAKKAGHVCDIFGTSTINHGPHLKSVTMTFKVSKKCPMVGLTAMLAPSPDWFTGLSNINLYHDGHWVKSATFKAYPYDSGGDAGTDYTSPNQDKNPKGPVRLAMYKPFVYNGHIKPVGKFIIKLK